MDAARRAAAALLAVGLLVGGARAQSDDGARSPSKPIPYTQLVRGEHASARRTPRARPKTRTPKPPAPSSAFAAAPTASPQPAAPQSAAPRPGPPQPASIAPPPPLRTPPVGAPQPALPAPVAAPRPPPPPPPPPQAAASAAARLAPGAPAPAAEVEAFVDAAMARDLMGGHGVGAVVAVVQNGQVVLEKGYGLADRATGRRFDPARTGVRLGAASRLLTDLFVLKLAEAGRLDLNASVDVALPPAERLPAEGFARTPRLGEVLQERGGFETREFGRAFRPAARVLPLDEAMRRLRAHRVREPGGPAIANDYGAALAGAAAAHAGGAEFETLVQTELLAPAGLASTSFREPRAARPGLPAPLSPDLAVRLAQGYAWTAHGPSPRPYGFAGGLAPALAATTTADDMARLMLMELGGGAGVWGPRAQAWLHAGPAPGEALSGPAYGRMRVRLPGGFAGFGESGAAPGFRVRYLVVPQLGLGVFVAANSETSGAVSELAPALVRRFYAGPTPSAVPDATGADAGPGLYLDARRAYHGLEGFVDRLERRVRVLTAEGGGLVTRGLGRAQAWAPGAAGAPLVATDGAELTVITGAHGRAEAVAEPGRAALAERVGWLHRPSTLAASAALAAAAALLVLGGLCARLAREGARPTGQQTAATVVQAMAALLWLGAITAFAVFRGESGARDVLRPWPDAWLVGASTAALVASALTLVQLGQLPGAWAEGRRLSGWAVGRKLRHTLSVLVFAAFAAVLASWGALEPWSS